MRPLSRNLDRLEVTFDDKNAVANGGLVLPMTLAERLGLAELVDENVHLGDAPGHANVGQKALALVASALVGGDSIDDAGLLRAGRADALLGRWVPAPSTLGTFLRSFSWADARSLDKVGAELLKRAWSAGAGPEDGLLTVDVDSTICRTYGLKKEGGTFGYTKVRGLHPLLATALGQVLGVRQRGGNAHSARGAASFLAEVFNRVRPSGATRAFTTARSWPPASGEGCISPSRPRCPSPSGAPSTRSHKTPGRLSLTGQKAVPT